MSEKYSSFALLCKLEASQKFNGSFVLEQRTMAVVSTVCPGYYAFQVHIGTIRSGKMDVHAKKLSSGGPCCQRVVGCK